MTQIIFGVSICLNNSKHFRISDFGLSTQRLPIQRHPDLGAFRNKIGFWLESSKSSHNTKGRHIDYALYIDN